MGPIQSVEEFIDLLRRRRLMIAAIVLLGAIISVMIGASRPKTYETGAVIQVESPVITEQAENAGAQSARVLQVIEQRLTTRENLTALIERHGLFADAPGMSPEMKINALRASITFQSVASATQQTYGTPASVSALLIITRLGDGEKAARVANDLAQNVLDMSVARQTSRARDSLRFFIEEEARVTQEIIALEAEIAAFKNENMLAQSTSGDSVDQAAITTDLRRISQELLALQTERITIESKSRLRETDRRRIDEITVQEAVLNNQEQALRAQLSEIRTEAAQTPEVERQLSAYNRQLQQLQSQYEIISARKAESETALRMEMENQTEHFSLLERATIPEYPNSGGGKKIAMAGTFASLIAAIGLAFLLDLMNPVLRSVGQMERELDIRPVITLPDLHLRQEARAGWFMSLWQDLWHRIKASLPAS